VDQEAQTDESRIPAPTKSKKKKSVSACRARCSFYQSSESEGSLQTVTELILTFHLVTPMLQMKFPEATPWPLATTMRTIQVSYPINHDYMCKLELEADRRDVVA
jgi:hypothetical protein